MQIQALSPYVEEDYALNLMLAIRIHFEQVTDFDRRNERFVHVIGM